MSATSWSYPARRFGCKDTHPFICIESCVLAAVAKVEEIGIGVIEKAVRISLDF
jgi:hypothetical protein